MDWAAKLAWAEAEHTERIERGPAAGERPDLHAAGVANASWAAGLAAAMLGDAGRRRQLLRRAAEEYRSSWGIAPAGSWGRPIAAVRCRLLAPDLEGARADSEWTLAEGAAGADGPFGRYAAALALLVLGAEKEAFAVSSSLREDDAFPADVAEALVAVASRDGAAFAGACRDVLRSFEERDAYLEDVRVADTVMVLQELASLRGLDPPVLESPLLPPG